MVFRKKFRPRATRPKRVFRRRRPMMRKKITNQVHRFVRWAGFDQYFPGITGPSTITSSGAIQNLSYSFNLRNVVNAVDFTALYDMYRINKVTVMFERMLNSTGTIGTNPYNYRCAIVHDYNDNNTLTDENDYLEYSNCKRYQIVGGGSIKTTLYPKVANVVENISGGSAFNAIASNKIWLNTADDQVPHFGIKVFIPAGVTLPDYGMFRVRVRYDLSFKNSK